MQSAIAKIQTILKDDLNLNLKYEEGKNTWQDIVRDLLNMVKDSKAKRIKIAWCIFYFLGSFDEWRNYEIFLNVVIKKIDEFERCDYLYFGYLIGIKQEYITDMYGNNEINLDNFDTRDKLIKAQEFREIVRDFLYFIETNSNTLLREGTIEYETNKDASFAEQEEMLKLREEFTKVYPRLNLRTDVKDEKLYLQVSFLC